MRYLTMEPLGREDTRAVLARFGIFSAQRAADTDSTEEVILLAGDAFASIDPTEVALAIMEVLPSTKVWVVESGGSWNAEPL
jgi:hypothetical protein